MTDVERGVSDELPHQGVYSPVSFVCFNDTGEPGAPAHSCLTTFSVRPEAEIASTLLEEVGEWWRALDRLPDGTEVPAGVTAAVHDLHEVVCNWTDFLAARRDSSRRKARAVLDPRPPAAS